MVKEYRLWKRLASGKVLIGAWHNNVAQAINDWADRVEADPDIIETGIEVREQLGDDPDPDAP